MNFNSHNLLNIIKEEVIKFIFQEQEEYRTFKKFEPKNIPGVGTDVWDPTRAEYEQDITPKSSRTFKKHAKRKWGSPLMYDYLRSLRYVGDGNWYVQDVSKEKGGDISDHGTHEQGIHVDLSIPMEFGVENKSHSEYDGSRKVKRRGRTTYKPGRFAGKKSANKGHAVYKTKEGTLGFFSPISIRNNKKTSNIDAKRTMEFLEHTLPISSQVILDRLHIKKLKSYAGLSKDKGGLGWNKKKIKSFFRKVTHHENHGHHFHIKLLDLESKRKRIPSVGHHRYRIPKKYKGNNEEEDYKNFKSLYDVQGESMYTLANSKKYPADFRVRMWKERTANLEAIAAEKESMRPDFKKEPWMDPEWRDTGPPEPFKPAQAGMTSPAAPASVEAYPKDAMSMDKPEEDLDDLKKGFKP